jgi:hypothetical protein
MLLFTLAAEMWVVCLRESVNHRDQDTTGVAKGFHSSTKSGAHLLGSENLRVDHLVHFLPNNIAELSEFKDAQRFHGELSTVHGHVHIDSIFFGALVACFDVAFSQACSPLFFVNVTVAFP